MDTQRYRRLELRTLRNGSNVATGPRMAVRPRAPREGGSDEISLHEVVVGAEPVRRDARPITLVESRTVPLFREGSRRTPRSGPSLASATAQEAEYATDYIASLRVRCARVKAPSPAQNFAAFEVAVRRTISFKR